MLLLLAFFTGGDCILCVAVLKSSKQYSLLELSAGAFKLVKAYTKAK